MSSSEQNKKDKKYNKKVNSLFNIFEEANNDFKASISSNTCGSFIQKQLKKDTLKVIKSLIALYPKTYLDHVSPSTFNFEYFGFDVMSIGYKFTRDEIVNNIVAGNYDKTNSSSSSSDDIEIVLDDELDLSKPEMPSQTIYR